jgi:hypothetical protein
VQGERRAREMVEGGRRREAARRADGYALSG